MATFVTPSERSWLPNWEKTAQLIGWIRNPDRFRINDWAALRPAKSNIGVYYVLDPNHSRRAISEAQYNFPEGAARPISEVPMRFDMPAYVTQRRAITVPIGRRTINNSAWPQVMINAKSEMSKAMMLMTISSLNVLETNANWTFGSTSNFNTFAYMATRGVTATGLFIPGATTTNNYIKTALDYALIQIGLTTGLGINPGDFNVLLSPNAAQQISVTNEMVDFIKQSRYAGPYIEGKNLGGPDGKRTERYNFSLPSIFHGYNLIVEDTSTVIALPSDDTTVPTFAKSDNSMIIMLKQEVGEGDQVGKENEVSENWSTFQIFYYDPDKGSDDYDERGPGGLAVLKTFEDNFNERSLVSVQWDNAKILVAPQTGWRITNLFS